MKRVIYSNEDIFAMSNVRGRYVKNPRSLPFSFYFSSGSGVSHDIRVNPMFNPEKLKKSLTGTLKLCDDWRYTAGSEDKNVDSKLILEMKQFFRKYLVLFCAVWDEQMQDAVLEDYFLGNISFNTMLKDLDFYEEHKESLDNISDVSSLEAYCRLHDLVNMYGN